MYRTQRRKTNPQVNAAAPLSACAIYLGVCTAWILFSDRLLASARLPEELAYGIASIKGIGFVIATTTLLFVLMQRNNRKIREVHDASLRGSIEVAHRLAHAIELRDVCTGEHIQRIAASCRLVGEEMGLDSTHLDHLVHAAPLHDVGKIAIPDFILQKPDALTTEEVALVRRHAELGAELLYAEGNAFMSIAATIARTHHEAWDGSGYPEGLKGDEIPLEGRIVAVCDVFDALISERPYKAPWTVEEAIAEIRRLSGTKFDPAVVRAFERAIPKLLPPPAESVDAFFEELQPLSVAA